LLSPAALRQFNQPWRRPQIRDITRRGLSAEPLLPATERYTHAIRRVCGTK